MRDRRAASDQRMPRAVVMRRPSSSPPAPSSSPRRPSPTRPSIRPTGLRSAGCALRPARRGLRAALRGIRPAALRRDRLAQRLHEVDDLAALLLLGLLAERGGRVDGVALLELGLDEGAQLLLVLVDVLLGLEVGDEALDELLRQVELLRRDPHGLVERGELRRPHLVAPEQRLHHQHVAVHSQRREPGLLPQRHAHDRRAVGGLERAAQQHVGLVRRGVGLEVVAAVEHDRIDLLGRHELGHLDLATALGGQRLQVLVGDDHRAFTVVVGLVDVLVVDDLAVDLADALIADASAVLVVHLVQ